MTLRLLIGIAVAWLTAAAAAQSPPAVILVTLDGARVEEVFGGLDASVVESQLKNGQRLEDQPLYKRYWAPTPEARREKLMPFFWGTLMQAHGSIAGNPRDRQPRAPDQSPLVFVSGLFGDPRRPRAR